jgi:hypothetical protein
MYTATSLLVFHCVSPNLAQAAYVQNELYASVHPNFFPQKSSSTIAHRLLLFLFLLSLVTKDEIMDRPQAPEGWILPSLA